MSHAQPAAAQVDQQRAQEYFREAQDLCERDGGRLWGVSLCGPMVIADASTGTIATSQSAPHGNRPREIGYVNAPVQWGGITWSAYVWQMIPEDRDERGRLFMHELFHRVQPGLGLTTGGVGAGENDHLDSLEGRYWMRLEWRALARALGAVGAARTTAVADALAFRAARHHRFPDAAAREHIVEINEGLATYTQYVTGSNGVQDATRSAMATLAASETGTSFVRTFAYASGAGYGLLLHALSPGWHRKITVSSDFGALLSAAAGVTAAPDALTAAARYGGAQVRAAEEQRDREQQSIIADLRRRYVDGPVLVVPRAGSGSSNNMGATVIPGVGTVFRAMANKGSWGSFDAPGGALVSADEKTIRLPAPVVVDATTLKGDGWTATVGPGWTVQPGPRAGSFRVVDEPAPEAQRALTRGVVYGQQEDGLALTLDVHRPAQPNGAGLICVVSGGWQSSGELARIFAQAYPPLNDKGFTVFAVRHSSHPRYALSSIVADMRRAVRFIRQHAKEYGVDPSRIGVFGNSSGGHLALLLGTTGDSGDPLAADPVLRESSRVAAVVANYPPTDLARWATQQTVFTFTDADAAQFSPIRYVSSSAAPALIVHGGADTSVPIDQGETMYAALTRAGVPASFIRVDGAEHGFAGAAPADLERAYTAMIQWFDQHLGSAASK